MTKKRLVSTFLLIVCTVGLLVGCTININVDSQSKNTTKETGNKTIFNSILNGKEEPSMYESRATIYITTSKNDNAAISSSDLTVEIQLAETYRVILQSDKVQEEIRKEYTGAEYTLTLEQINETEVFALIATSENPEKLQEICNMAASLLCETVQQTIEGTSCRIVDCATSAKLVEKK